MLPNYATPAAPGKVLIRNTQEKTISKQEHMTFRSGVGILLYLVKHSRPELANAVRELTKVMDNPNKEHFKSLYRTIKYVLDTEDYGICLSTNKNIGENWILAAYSDSTYGGDSDKRLSITGWIILIEGMILSWKSQPQ